MSPCVTGSGGEVVGVARRATCELWGNSRQVTGRACCEGGHVIRVHDQAAI